MPNLLLQKFPAPEFTADVVLTASELRSGERAGLIVFGETYAWIGFEQRGAQRVLAVRSVERAMEGNEERLDFSEPFDGTRLTVRVTVAHGAEFRFAVVDNGKTREVGRTFQAKPGRWVGAKVGLFAAAPAAARDTGWASFERFALSAQR